MPGAMFACDAGVTMSFSGSQPCASAPAAGPQTTGSGLSSASSVRLGPLSARQKLRASLSRCAPRDRSHAPQGTPAGFQDAPRAHLHGAYRQRLRQRRHSPGSLPSRDPAPPFGACRPSSLILREGTSASLLPSDSAPPPDIAARPLTDTTTTTTATAIAPVPCLGGPCPRDRGRGGHRKGCDEAESQETTRDCR